MRRSPALQEQTAAHADPALSSNGRWHSPAATGHGSVRDRYSARFAPPRPERPAAPRIVAGLNKIDGMLQRRKQGRIEAWKNGSGGPVGEALTHPKPFAHCSVLSLSMTLHGDPVKLRTLIKCWYRTWRRPCFPVTFEDMRRLPRAGSTIREV